MAFGEVKVTAKKLDRRKKFYKYLKRIVALLFIIILTVFFILTIVYKGGNFTVTLDPNFSLESGIVLYESLDRKDKKNKLSAKEIEFMDNISGEWIPQNINDEKDGSHNGQNYIAYTFYVENEGKEVLNYWYQINVIDVIKNVDEAIRIKVYQNGVLTTYGKKNSLTNKKENDAEEFYSEEIPVLKQRTNFKPNDIDKYTVVIYLEGDDPDCVDAIIGGEIKMKMEITEEHIKQDEK